MGDPRMYGELASWFHLVTAPADYADEAEDVVRLLADHGVELGPANPDATLLELGSGGGNTASHLKAGAHLTLTDIAPAMLALRRRRLGDEFVPVMGIRREDPSIAHDERHSGGMEVIFEEFEGAAQVALPAVRVPGQYDRYGPA